MSARPQYRPQLPARDHCNGTCETIAGCTCTRLPGPAWLGSGEARELQPDIGWREWGDACTDLGALLDSPAAPRTAAARRPGTRPPILTPQMRNALRAAANTALHPLRTLRLALKRALLEWHIRSALDEVALIDHYAELDPIRRRFLTRQIGGMQVRLCQLNARHGRE